jgi:hypothetical protein
MKGSQMQTSPEMEGLLANPQPLEAAANEFAGRPGPSGGWDPYEVWRTRVKAVKDDTDDSGAALA